ncbi:hypothetical protein L218DRAFT_967210 [Marasmius fiardii PR-910]|nr:hypothetical protein L218DRAFT_967210 [Marasmius fiardii PR-910]
MSSASTSYISLHHHYLAVVQNVHPSMLTVLDAFLSQPHSFLQRGHLPQRCYPNFEMHHSWVVDLQFGPLGGIYPLFFRGRKPLKCQKVQRTRGFVVDFHLKTFYSQKNRPIEPTHEHLPTPTLISSLNFLPTGFSYFRPASFTYPKKNIPPAQQPP